MAVDAARPGLPQRIAGFYADVRAEMVKVTWPDKAQVRQATIVIIGVVLFVGLVIALLDLALQGVLVRLPQMLFGR